MTGKRILALDPGTKRMGVALSDELGWTAQPLETYERRSLAADLAHVQDLVRRHEVRRIIVGMPLHMSGRSGPQARLAEEFIHQLEQVLDVPVIPWDERLTSKSAEALLIEANVSRKKRKGTIDRVAAAILLQSYLETLSAPAPASSDGGL
jgi:putative Holliday junction resolvase